ncbi:hypothetical protein [Enterobacter hormaechei]|nr:hypothetical protein [Enterobacter hormaechei]MBQ0357221.1 hypothetical protein [Enterobacter hormaechei]
MTVSNLIAFNTQGNAFGGLRAADAGNLAAQVVEVAVCIRQSCYRHTLIN